MDEGELEQAERLLKEADSTSHGARFYLLRGDHGKAGKSYKKILELAEKSRNADSLFIAYTGLGTVYEALQEYEKAGECYEKGMQMVEKIRSSLAPAIRESFLEVKINGFARSEPAKGLKRVRKRLSK